MHIFVLSCRPSGVRPRWRLSLSGVNLPKKIISRFGDYACEQK